MGGINIIRLQARCGNIAVDISVLENLPSFVISDMMLLEKRSGEDWVLKKGRDDELPRIEIRVDCRY
jgi:hypothetical protein